MTHMTSDLVSKIFLILVSKILLFIFVILYRPTLLTIWFDIFDDLTILTGNLIPFYAAYLSLFNTELLRTLRLCLHSHRAMKWTEWMYRVWCAVFQCIYIFPRPFNIVYSPCLSYIQWYHDHNVFTKSYSKISLQHHLVAYRMPMSSTLPSIPGNECCHIYFSLYTPILSEPNL